MGSSDTKSQKDFASLVRSTDDTQNVHFACCRWTQGIFFWKFFILRFAAAIVSVDPSPSTKGAMFFIPKRLIHCYLYYAMLTIHVDLFRSVFLIDRLCKQSHLIVQSTNNLKCLLDKRRQR